MFSKDTCDMIHLLNKHHVHYMIVGGYAAIYHGYVRFTADIDFFYKSDEENSIRLFQAFQEFWEGTVPVIESYLELTKKGRVFQFGQPPNRLDFINEIDGVLFEHCIDTMCTVNIQCDKKILTVHFIGLDELIKNKKASGRPKDLIDADYLEKIKNSSTD